MAKQRRAKQKDIPKDSTISYHESQIESCWEDTLDPHGRFVTPLTEYAGYHVVMYVLKKKNSDSV